MNTSKKNEIIRQIMYLEVVQNLRSFKELYIKSSRDQKYSMGIDYKWVAGVRAFLKEKKYIKILEGKNYLVITHSGRKYFLELKDRVKGEDK